jgi:CDP-diacylglycerol--glycerol-3-phosphate 3-phosphatidyltransferase
MATVVVVRELAVTSLRSVVEGQGGDFSARQLGKWKMAFQCAAVILALWSLAVTGAPGSAIVWLRQFAVWIAILLTLASALDYGLVAARHLQVDRIA